MHQRPANGLGNWGDLARYLGYGDEGPEGSSVIGYLEGEGRNASLRVLSEPRWLDFLERADLPETTQPGHAIDSDHPLARGVIEGRHRAVEEWSIEDSLDEMAAAAITKMDARTRKVLGYMFSDPEVIGRLTDHIWGQCADQVSQLVRDAYTLHRKQGGAR